MSLTSYRAAPPRDDSKTAPWRFCLGADLLNEIVMGFLIVCAGFNAWRRPTLPTLER